jgi:hypothetical protein
MNSSSINKARLTEGEITSIRSNKSQFAPEAQTEKRLILAEEPLAFA